jgi:hypothetical protein
VSEEEARVALREALEALIKRGETVEVSVDEMTPSRLFELADEVRSQSRPDVSIAWVPSGALTYMLGPSVSY